MNIGKTIKQLRCEQGITQEKLAEKLGITANAISQWECGRTMPDIAVLPLLSETFRVSADVLLGIDITQFKRKKEIESFVITCSQLHSEGKIAEWVQICRKYQAKYPNDESVLYQLMRALKAENEHFEEIIQLGMSLLFSENTEYRYGAIRVLALTCYEMGEKEKAVGYARMMPPYDDLLVHVLEGEELVKHCQKFFYDMCEQAELHLHVLLNTPESGYTPADRHKLQMQMIRLFHAVFEDGDFGLYYERLGRLYFKAAVSSAQSGDEERTLGELETMCDCFEKTRDFEEVTHTSLLVNRLALDKSQIKKHDDISVGKRFLRYMTLAFGEYEELCKRDRYLTVMDRLRSI